MLRRARDVLPEMHVWAITGAPSLLAANAVACDATSGLIRSASASRAYTDQPHMLMHARLMWLRTTTRNRHAMWDA